MKLTPNLRLWLYGGAALFLANLFVMNDMTTLLPGAEVRMGWEVLSGRFSLSLPVMAGRLFSAGQMEEFLLRLPGVLVFLLSMGGTYLMARPILGQATTLSFLLVLGASLLVPNITKLATADIWTFSLHLAGFFALLRFLKQPGQLWRWLFYGLLALSIWVQPIKALLFFGVAWGMLFWLHPRGERLQGLHPWLAAAVVTAGLHAAGALDWTDRAAYFHFNPGYFLLFNLLGFLPFAGFLMAGLRDTTVKVRRGEELAVINTAWIVAALAGQSIVLQAAFALLSAKHLAFYFEERYPYRSLVRAGAVLHLVLIFFVVLLVITGAFVEFSNAGFRAGITFGAIYWILSLVVIFGLFGINQRMVWGGTLMSGLLATFLFWMQLGPLIESRRDLPRRIAAEAAYRKAGEERPFYLFTPGAGFSTELLYSRARLERVESIRSLSRLQDRLANKGRAIFAAPLEAIDSTMVGPDSTVKYGWDQRMRGVEWVIWEVRSPKSEVRNRN